MARNTSILNKGSILPSIVELEAELTERENEAMKIAEERIHKAKLTGEKLVEDTLKELPQIEEGERKKLLEGVDARVEELKSIEERESRELEQIIERNKKGALDFVLKKVLPRWDEQFPD